MSDSHKNKCWLPWRMFRIMSDGNISMCCSNRSVIGNIFRNTFEEIWNSDNAMKFRSFINDGSYIEAGCATCAFWYTFKNYLFDFPENEITLSPERELNRKVQLLEYQSGKTRLESRPSILFIQPSYLCNLDCVMCNQKHVRSESEETQAVMPGLMSYLQNLEPLVENIIIQGGEPLLVQEILGYLEKTASCPSEHFITLNTNGLLFHRHVSLLKRIRRLKINFSVDAGSREIYKKIRVGGDWDRLLENIGVAVRISQQDDNEWSVNIQNLVMKSNIEHVHEMVQFWAEMAPSQKIYPVLGLDNVTENVFIYNHLLEQVPSWQSSLIKASQMATNYGLDELWLGLQYCRELLECKPLLTSDIHQLLSESMPEEEYLNYFNNIASYKIAHVNGFTDKEHFKHVKLRHLGFS